jgi:signal transduction histidine kinase
MSHVDDAAAVRRRTIRAFALSLALPAVALAGLGAMAVENDAAATRTIEGERVERAAANLALRLGEVAGERLSEVLRAAAPAIFRAAAGKERELACTDPLAHGFLLVGASGSLLWPPPGGAPSPWREALAGEILPFLAKCRVFEGDLPQPLLLSRLGEPPLLLAGALHEAGGGEEAPWGGREERAIVAFAVDLEALADALAPLLVTAEEGHASRLLGARGCVLLPRADAAAPTLANSPRDVAGVAALEGFLDWRVEVRVLEETLRALALRRSLLHVAMIAVALLAVGYGSWKAYRVVGQSLELARLKSDFVSSVTHELKTPLTSIRMFAELLALGRVRSRRKQQEYHERILRESARLQKLIEDLLDFARMEAGKSQYILAENDVADTAREAIDLFRYGAQAHGVPLFVELPPVGSLPPVDLDRDAIVRVLLNLLGNAVKYSPDRGAVRVDVAREGDEIAIRVEDQGIGIDGEEIDLIFEKFYRVGDELTREVAGTGLGLALVSHIVDAHGGRIEVASEKGAGSTFTVFLPIVAEYRDLPWPLLEADSAAFTSEAPLDSGESAPEMDAAGAAEDRAAEATEGAGAPEDTRGGP